MATRGRPKRESVHQVSYYTPKAELALKAHQKVLEKRLKDGYTDLYKLGTIGELNNIDFHEINNAVKQALKLI
jgi:hypothetical protein